MIKIIVVIIFSFLTKFYAQSSIHEQIVELKNNAVTLYQQFIHDEGYLTRKDFDTRSLEEIIKKSEGIKDQIPTESKEKTIYDFALGLLTYLNGSRDNESFKILSSLVNNTAELALTQCSDTLKKHIDNGIKLTTEYDSLPTWAFIKLLSKRVELKKYYLEFSSYLFSQERTTDEVEEISIFEGVLFNKSIVRSRIELFNCITLLIFEDIRNCFGQSRRIISFSPDFQD